MTKTIDMTRKNPLYLLITICAPLIVGNIFQQLYTFVDAIIVGRYLGADALAAIGTIDWIQWMLNTALIGLSGGFSVVFSNCFGKKDYPKLRQNIFNGFLLSIVVGILFVALSELFATSFLTWMAVPSEIYDIALTYIRYLFLGLPVVMIYNFLSGTLRAFGNSRTPLVATVIATIVNIVLDLYFIVQLKMGIEGAATATVISQIFSAIYCFMVLKKIEIVQLQKEDCQYDLHMCIHLLRIGIPIVMMNLLVGISGVIVQRYINDYGVVFVGATSITYKLYGLFETAAISIGLSVTTFVAQNYGAKQIDRIKQGIKSAIFLSLITACIISLLMLVYGKNIISLFLSSESDNYVEIIAISYEYLSVMAKGLWILYLLHTVRYILQGLGNTMVPLYSSIVELGLRIFSVTCLSLYIHEYAVYFAEINAWIGALIVLSCGLVIEFKRKLIDKLQ